MLPDTTIERTLKRAGDLAIENTALRAEVDRLKLRIVELEDKNHDQYVALSLVNNWCSNYVTEIMQLKAQLAAAQALERVPDRAIRRLMDYGMPLGTDSTSWQVARETVRLWLQDMRPQTAGQGEA